MSLTFNIVYTPGTVPYLSLFVKSLLKWSDCRFRLVSNGCLTPERRALQQLCDAHPRLSYHTIPTNGTADHGTVLNYLQAMTTEEHFCFMDSDLLAVGEFVPEILPHVREAAGVFSGAPLWTTRADQILPADFQLVSGVHHQTESGTCLGSSYFAVYDNQALTACLQSTGVGFQTYRWEQLPTEIQREFRLRGWQKQGYDTAKVLNLLMQAQGHVLRYFDLNGLCHIGGFSFLRAEARMITGWKSWFSERLVNGPAGRVLQPLRRAWRERAAGRRATGLSDRERKAIVARRTRQRDPTRRYFQSLLTALVRDQPLPEKPIVGIPAIDASIARATNKIRTLHHDSSQGISSRDSAAA